MTIEEAKRVLKSGDNVEYKGARYKKISALRFVNVDGIIRGFCELLDMNENSIIVTDVDSVKEIEDGSK